MKVSLLTKTPKHSPGFKVITCLILTMIVGIGQMSLLAEGTRDASGSGNRLWLDTRDDQQLNVYVNQGEYINVGASHVGFSSGYIEIYDPMGNPVRRFDNTVNNFGLTGTPFNSTGLGIINNSDEEAAGPSGVGGSGPGYTPGIVMAEMSGIYTIVLNYDQPYSISVPFDNIPIGASWTRDPLQPPFQPEGPRVILAWDITVSSGAPANQAGSDWKTGRVYTNEYIALLDGNNNGTTSPTFIVLDADGYQYEINIMMADPYRFPLSSNSLGLVRPDDNGLFVASYQSSIDSSQTCIPQFYERSNDPNSWVANELYLYEPQAEDFGVLRNNKLFLNPPDPDMPATANVYDVFRDNPHNTWLYSEPEILTVLDVTLQGNDGCDDGFIEFEKGGTINITTNIAGTATIVLDLDNNGILDFNEPEDVTISGPVGPGEDPLQWDGNNGLGVPVQVADSFDINITGSIRFGEIHIALEDVEAIEGGVTFNMINPPTGLAGPFDQFFYDHSNINDLLDDLTCANPPDPLTGQLVSGGGSPGDPQPTNSPFTYIFNQGNNLYLDQWTFREVEIDVLTIPVNVVLNCVCEPDETPVVTIDPVDPICSGDPVTITASNSVSTFDTIIYNWTGPNGFAFNDTLTNVTGTSSANDPQSPGGTYTVIATSNLGCSDTVMVDVTINTTPVMVPNANPVLACVGDDVQLCAMNTTPGIGQMTCTWTGPNGFSVVETVNGDDDICVSLTNVDQLLSGDYTVVCSFNGCDSDPLTITLDVQLAPEINGISPNGSFCQGTDVELTAMNVVQGTGPITYTWTGPNGQVCMETTQSETGPFTCTVFNIQPSDAGTYTLVLETQAGCESTPQSVEIEVDLTPEICNVTGGGDACVGQDVTLSGFNCNVGIAFPVNYTWTDQNGNTVCTGAPSNDGPYECVLTNVQTTDSGTYTLNVTDANGCMAASVSVDLNVLPGLNIIDPTPDSNYCEGTDVVLTATNTVNAGTLTYTWTGPNGDICTDVMVNWDELLSCTISGITANDVGTYTLNVTSAAGCVSSPVNVEVGLHPTINIDNTSGGGQFCTLDTIVLDGTGSGTATDVSYTWTSPSGEVVGMGSGLTPAGPFPGIDTTPEEGSYTLTVTTSEGCTDVATEQVTLGCTPIANILFGDTVLCDRDTLTLVAQNDNDDCGDITYTWTTPNGSTVTGSGNGTTPFMDEILPLSDFGSGYYILTISSQGCTSEPDSVFIELNPNPVISAITGGGVYCPGDTAIVCFTQTNPAVTDWFWTCNYGQQQVTGTGTGMEEICLIITEATFVFCSIESADGCVSDLEGTEIIYDSGFDLDVTPDTTICSNETLVLNGSNNEICAGTVTYEWTGPGGFSFSGTAPCTGPFPATVTDPQTGEYCLMVQSTSGNCADTACVNVTVNPTPFVEPTGIVGGGEFCEGDSTILSAVIDKDGGGDIDYEWTLNGNSVATGTAPAGSTVVLDLGGLTSADSGQYCLLLTCAATGCSSDGDDCTDVTVSPTPNITSTSGAGTYCEGFNVELSAEGDPGPGTVTYTWEGPNFSFTGQAPCGGPYPATINDIQVDQAGLYTLTVTKGDCVSDPVTIPIEVNPTPDIINASAGGIVCAGDTTVISFTIDPDGADTVFWSVSGPGLDESGSVTTLTEFDFEVVVDGGGSYIIMAESNLGCEADPVTITLEEAQVPTPVLEVSTEILCPGDPLQLTTSEEAGATYTWCKDGVALGTTTDPIFDVDPPMGGDYQVKLTIDGCTETSATITVVEPTVPDAVDDTFNSTSLGPVSGNVLSNDDTGGGVSVTVVTPPSVGSVVIGPDGSMTYTPEVAGTHTFEYEICNLECPELCDIAMVTIIIEVDCEVPNVITPNGDGINDLLIIDCLPPEGGNSRLRIFNRWGDEIAVFDPYVNDWDGTNGDDEPLPNSTYYYLFEEDKSSGDTKAGFIKVYR